MKKKEKKNKKILQGKEKTINKYIFQIHEQTHGKNRSIFIRIKQTELKRFNQIKR